MSSTTLIILVVLAIVVFAVKTWNEKRIDQKLLEEPPEKVLFEVRLPRGIDDANLRQQKFYRKIMKLTATDAAGRKKGAGVMDALYLAEVPENRNNVELRFMVYCPPDQLQVIKRTLKQTFGGLAEITTPTGDPIQEIVDGLRPPQGVGQKAAKQPAAEIMPTDTVHNKDLDFDLDAEPDPNEILPTDVRIAREKARAAHRAQQQAAAASPSVSSNQMSAPTTEEIAAVLFQSLPLRDNEPVCFVAIACADLIQYSAWYPSGASDQNILDALPPLIGPELLKWRTATTLSQPPNTGAWLAARFNIHPNGAYDVDFDYDTPRGLEQDRPGMTPALLDDPWDAETYQKDVQMFPRRPEAISDHIRQRLQER